MISRAGQSMRLAEVTTPGDGLLWDISAAAVSYTTNSDAAASPPLAFPSFEREERIMMGEGVPSKPQLFPLLYFLFKSRKSRSHSRNIDGKRGGVYAGHAPG